MIIICGTVLLGITIIKKYKTCFATLQDHVESGLVRRQPFDKWNVYNNNSDKVTV
jgi:hypothetical protein